MKNFFKNLVGQNGQANAEQKNNIFPDYMYQSYIQGPGKAMWSGRDYRKFSDEAYIKNVIAHQSIKRVVTAASSIKLKVRMDDVVMDKKFPLCSLLAAPNPCSGDAEFFEEVFSYKLISGNAFILAIGPRDGAPQELHCLRPDRVSIIAGKDGLPKAYRYKLDNKKYRDYSRDQVLHLKYFHPLDDWYGLSPVEAAAYSIDQHNQAGEWNQALLQNGARPSGAMIVKSPDGKNGGNLSEDQYNRIKSQIDNEFAGAANSGRPLLLEGGLEWKEMSLNPKDMDFVEMKHSAARDIALAFGVPPQLLGIPGDNTYSNLAEARQALWELTVIPLVNKMLGALNHWLAPAYGNGIEIYADLDNVEALSPRREARWRRISDSDFLTDEEKRKLLGL